MLTRRVKAKSTRSAIVVRFSKSRQRYERRGLLVEADALAEVERALKAEAAEAVPRPGPRIETPVEEA